MSQLTNIKVIWFRATLSRRKIHFWFSFCSIPNSAQSKSTDHKDLFWLLLKSALHVYYLHIDWKLWAHHLNVSCRSLLNDLWCWLHLHGKKIGRHCSAVRAQPEKRLQSTFYARMQINILLVFRHFFPIYIYPSMSCRIQNRSTGNKIWTRALISI